MAPYVYRQNSDALQNRKEPLHANGPIRLLAGAAWATTVSCYASAVCAWIMVARRPGGPWLPQPRKLFATAFLGKEVEGESKGWAAWFPRALAGVLQRFAIHN